MHHSPPADFHRLTLERAAGNAEVSGALGKPMELESVGEELTLYPQDPNATPNSSAPSHSGAKSAENLTVIVAEERI